MADGYSAIRIGGAALSQARPDLLDSSTPTEPGVFAMGGQYRGSRASGHTGRRQPKARQVASAAASGGGDAAMDLQGRFRQAPPKSAGVSRETGGRRRDRSVVTASTASIRAKASSPSTRRAPSGRYRTKVSPVQGSPKAKAAAAAVVKARGSPKSFSQRRFDRKVADPFAVAKPGRRASAFVEAYNSGFPARLAHSGAQTKPALRWDKGVLSVDIDRLLPLCAGGLVETDHPYAFVAKQCFLELVAARPAEVPALLSMVVRPVRAALGSRNDGTFAAGLASLVALSTATGPALTEYLPGMLSPLSGRMLKTKWKDAVTGALQTLEQNGGPEAGGVIKKKIPTYTSIFF